MYDIKQALKSKNTPTEEKKGGIVLSEGGYGCIMKPKIACSGKQTNDENYITKIQQKNFFSDNEVYISSLIKQTENYERYFSVIESSCLVPLRKITSREIKKCKDTLNKVSVAMLGQIRYIESTNLFELLGSVEPNSAILYIINSFKILLVALDSLVKIDVIHFDIKPDNILFDLARRTPIVIDFGISIHKEKLVTLKDFQNHFYVFYPKYYIWCLDIHYICYLINVNQNPTLLEIEGICDDYINDNPVLNDMFSDRFIKKYRQSCVDAFKRYIGKNYMLVIKRLLKHSHTWDMFSVANIYLKVISFWFSKGYTNNPFIIAFSEILVQSIHPFYERRLSVADVQSEFNSFFYTQGNYSEIMRIVNNVDQEGPFIRSRVKKERTAMKRLEKHIRTIVK